jgi:hypothetical protein
VTEIKDVDAEVLDIVKVPDVTNPVVAVTVPLNVGDGSIPMLAEVEVPEFVIGAVTAMTPEGPVVP